MGLVYEDEIAGIAKHIPILRSEEVNDVKGQCGTLKMYRITIFKRDITMLQRIMRDSPYSDYDVRKR